ncbi:molybdopterin-dependent oxidoreductase [Salinarchaeum laminariae]|uniref:molybdopterin-dependent oxidoreductase n=1 Tax=Salinarchaeum laminariae TaxID=869888 RepID=UPI0020BFE3D8|nr:molybdopterin-dependent oxidoreductase [Salinarchaeum laminariae]
MTTPLQPKRTAFFATVAGLAGLALGYASGGWTSQYYAVVVSEFVTEWTPAAAMNWAIQELGSTAETLQVLGALVLAFALLAAIAAFGLLLGYRRPKGLLIGALFSALLAGAIAAYLTGNALQTVTVAVGVGIPVAVGESGARVGLDGKGEPLQVDPGRREAVGVIGALLGVGIISSVLGDYVTNQARAIDAEGPANAESLRERVEAAQAASLGIEGVQPPISEIGGFYTVSKNTAPEIVDQESWTLSITGSVEETVEIDYQELRDRPAEDRFVALRCIGDSLNGDLLDTALWTGIPLSRLLDEAGVEASHVEMHAADGYVASVPVETLENGFLAYGMNGEVLPRTHGFPARIHLPGTWGELNVKWIETIYATDDPVEGFYEEAGWNGHARVPGVAKIWTDPANELDDGRLEVGGHAYAGDRGVDRVEVSVDGGETWNDAELADPPPGDDVTRQWRYRYEADAEHEVVARTIDGEGNRQPQERSDAFPSGPSGWVSKTVNP